MDYGLQPGKPEHEVQSLQKSSDRNENISLEPLAVWERDSSQLAGNNCILIVDVSIGQPVCSAVCTATEKVWTETIWARFTNLSAPWADERTIDR